MIGTARDPCEVCGDQGQLPQVRVPTSSGVKRILQMTAVARDVPATKVCALPAISPTLAPDPTMRTMALVMGVMLQLLLAVSSKCPWFPRRILDGQCLATRTVVDCRNRLSKEGKALIFRRLKADKAKATALPPRG